MTTAQSLPRTPTDMMLAAEMALKAYSAVVSAALSGPIDTQVGYFRKLTDLVQATIVGEDGNVTIVCVSCTLGGG